MSTQLNQIVEFSNLKKTMKAKTYGRKGKGLTAADFEALTLESPPKGRFLAMSNFRFQLTYQIQIQTTKQRSRPARLTPLPGNLS